MIIYLQEPLEYKTTCEKHNYASLCNIAKEQITKQALKFGGNDCFITTSFPSLIKDGNDNLFAQMFLHNTNAFF